MTDGQLLDRFVTSHDESAFEALVRRHGPMILGLCRRALRDGHEAEDAFQATFLVLVRNAATIRKRESLACWLYGVAQRVTLKAKMGARQRDRLTQGEAMAANENEPQGDLNEIRPVLNDEVGRLPEKYRAPIVLCYLEGQTHEEAARQLDWPVGTVKGRLSRARELLHSRLTRRGITLSLGLVAMLESEARAAVPERLVEKTVRAAVAIASRPPAGANRPGPLFPRRLVVILAVLSALFLVKTRGHFLRETAASSQIPLATVPGLVYAPVPPAWTDRDRSPRPCAGH